MEPNEIVEWLYTRKFVAWDMDGRSYKTSDGLWVAHGPLLSLFHGRPSGRVGAAHELVVTQMEEAIQAFLAEHPTMELVRRPDTRKPLTAEKISAAMLAILKEHPMTRLLEWPETPDPFDHFKTANQKYEPPVRDFVNALLTLFEMWSAETSLLATNIDKVTNLLGWREVRQGIATNNATVAARWALRFHGMDDKRFGATEGRPEAGEVHMKPHPYTLDRVVESLGMGAHRRHGVFIGDSVSDGKAAKAAGIPFLGIDGNEPGKNEELITAGAIASISSVGELWDPRRCERGGDLWVPEPVAESKTQRLPGLRAAGAGFDPGSDALSQSPPLQAATNDRPPGAGTTPARGFGMELRD